MFYKMKENIPIHPTLSGSLVRRLQYSSRHMSYCGELRNFAAR